MFQSISMISALKMAYVVFPSINSAKAIYNVKIEGNNENLDA